MVFCSKCGSENKDSNEKCEKCGEFLLKPEFFKAKTEEKFEDIFTKENLKAISELTIENYYQILINIVNMGHFNLAKIIQTQHIDWKKLSALEKISILTFSYSKWHYKSEGEELGFYTFNNIYIDDRLYDSNKISTMIHELSHHIFSEIFEQILMYVWECDKSDAIEALVAFTLSANTNYSLSNEYCAHTCEGRFIPFGYQHYGSFEKIIKENYDPEKDYEIIQISAVFGNTIAKDIIRILEEFITPELMDEIKEEFKKGYSLPPTYGIVNETKDILPNDVKIDNIIGILISGFQAAQNEDAQKLLENFKETFTNANTN